MILNATGIGICLTISAIVLIGALVGLLVRSNMPKKAHSELV